MPKRKGIKRLTGTKYQRKRRAIAKMVRTKQLLTRLEMAKKARSMIDNGATMEDIAKEFHCTSLKGVISHIRAAAKLGGDIASNVSDFFNPQQSRTRTFAEEQVRRASGGIIDLDKISKAFQLAPQIARRSLEAQFGIQEGDDAFTVARKIFSKIYGLPENFDPSQLRLKVVPKDDNEPKGRVRRIRKVVGTTSL